MASLAEIRAKLAEKSNKFNNKSSTGGDRALYKHWDIEFGSSCTLRFLPDGDPKNTFFWVERQIINLEFPGIAGGEQKPVIVRVPCGHMYGDPCAVSSEVTTWYDSKDPALEAMASRYWKKRSYVFQGFVVEDPMNQPPVDNPIRRFNVNPQIFNIIKSSIMDPEMEDLPIDYVRGVDFRVTKTKKGTYADYGTSKWLRKERALNSAELDAIETHKLWNLSDYLPPRPTADHYRAIKEMFEASVNGELYDPARWSQYYKPFGLESKTQDTEESAQLASPAPSKSESVKAAPAPADDVPFDVDPPKAPAATTKKPSAEDLLRMIHSRKTAG